MGDLDKLSFRLKSKNNEYIIKIKIQHDVDPEYLEISLIHKLRTGDINFLLQSSKDELIKDNDFLSQFDSIQEIFNYFVKIIQSQKISIIKPSSTCYFINFYDQERIFNFQVILPKKVMNINEKKIEELERKAKEQQNKISELESEIQRLSKLEGNCIGNENRVSHSGISFSNNSIRQDNNDNFILRENNNNISFDKIPDNLGNVKIKSDERDECENFTAFINKEGGSIIVWTIKGKGILNLYDFKKDDIIKLEAHSHNINCVQYFHDHNKKIDYIITLSKLDIYILKIWEIDNINGDKLLLRQIYPKQKFKKEIEIFCTFNYSDYDSPNSYLFIYGKHLENKKMNQYDYNAGKNKEISCYKLKEDLNIIDWGKDEDGNLINYKIINNFYKINYLDVYYDIKNKELYLINCNENSTEIVNELFDNCKGSSFKYKNWNYYKSAFIKEKNGRLKLFQVSSCGIVIWDLESKEVEAFKEFENYCPFDFLSWKDDYLFVLCSKEIIILEIIDNKIEIKETTKKSLGFSKIRKIISPESIGIIVAIDDHKLKCWEL